MLRQLTLIIKPVSVDCNLRCSYCYNDYFRHNQKKFWNKITKFTLKNLIFQISRIDIEPINFIWHGGEPLLAGLSFYKEAIFLQKKYLQGKSYRNSLQTNGTLITKEWADFFKKHNFRIGVSVDGPEKIHNKYRRFPDSRGSFDAVMQGIKILKAKKVEIGFLAVITKDSIAHAKEIFNFFASNALYRMNFSACAEKAENKLTDFSISPLDYANFMIEIFDNWMKKDDPKIKIQLIENLFQGLIGGRPTICHYTGECSSYLAIDANGDVYLCGRFMGIDEFKIGNIIKQSLGKILFSHGYKDISQKTNSLKEECMKCKWNSICNGGCSYYRYMNGGLLSSPYYFCSSTKKILNHMHSTIKRIDSKFLVIN